MASLAGVAAPGGTRAVLTWHESSRRPVTIRLAVVTGRSGARYAIETGGQSWELPAGWSENRARDAFELAVQCEYECPECGAVEVGARGHACPGRV